jgi:predicted porin
MYTMGQSEFHLNVGGTKSGGDGAFRFGGAKQYTLGYNYNLSKRTKVYGFYTKTDYNAPGQLDFNSLAAGIRHNF